MLRGLVFVLTLLACGRSVIWAGRSSAASTEGAELLFSGQKSGSTIFIPEDALEVELRAAMLLQSTLARAGRREAWRFPIRRETQARSVAGIFVGRTRAAGAFFGRAPTPPFDTAVGFSVSSTAVVLCSERRSSIEVAAGWFLTAALGANWFMPGPLGEVVPVRPRVALTPGRTVARPGFVSRNLGALGSGEAGRAWSLCNGLEERLEHGHSFGSIFRPDDLRRTPVLAPWRSGLRYFPAVSDENWQPNIAAPQAVEHAAGVIGRAFAEDTGRSSFPLCVNDSVRFDESSATLGAVAPPRFFRGRPDYSDLVFGFTNAVAARVAREYPDRWLTAYAYYWAENAPQSQIARNVAPILAADRAQWFDPAFAAEDRQLIERWARSGAGLVGVYDYFYGAPFLVPRPTLYAVRDSLPFEYHAGVRVFYAEATPNWALDGPKLWLTARLLWQPDADVDALMATYYREFWREAAEPMREFFGRCEVAWQTQPRPGYWLKYYRDDHQVLLFPPEMRAALRHCLAAARAMARSPEIHARVELVAAGFSVTEAFADYCEARSKLAEMAGDTVAALTTNWRAYVRARGVFIQREKQVRRQHPFALAPHDSRFYLRNEPDGRVLRRLSAQTDGRAALAVDESFTPLLRGATATDWARVFAKKTSPLNDPAWRQVQVGSVERSIDFVWTPAESAWQGTGEPAEGRTVTLRTGKDGSRILRFERCKRETFSQWAPVVAGTLCVAEARIRAKVSPGSSTHLILIFLDQEQRHIGIGAIDRMPPGTATEELCVVGRAPRDARWVGIGLCVTNQVAGDFAEFDSPALKLQ